MNPIRVEFPDTPPTVALVYLTGWRDQNCSLDTLKKLSKSRSSLEKEVPLCVWQAFPLRSVFSPRHLVWSAFQVWVDWQFRSLHFRQPELEWIGRLAGTFQWMEAQTMAGIRETDRAVVVAGMGPASAVTPTACAALAREWGLKPMRFPKWEKSRGMDLEPIEQSALAGIQ